MVGSISLVLQLGHEYLGEQMGYLGVSQWCSFLSLHLGLSSETDVLFSSGPSPQGTFTLFLLTHVLNRTKTVVLEAGIA